MNNTNLNVERGEEAAASPTACQHGDDAAAQQDGAVPSQLNCSIKASEAIVTANAREYSERAARDYAKAKYLIKKNPHVFDCLVRDMRRRVGTGGQIKVDEVAAYMRKHDLTGSNGEAFKVNHNLIPAIVRELAKMNPDLRPHIKMRKSKFDAFYSCPAAKANDDLGR